MRKDNQIVVLLLSIWAGVGVLTLITCILPLIAISVIVTVACTSLGFHFGVLFLILAATVYFVWMGKIIRKQIDDNKT